MGALPLTPAPALHPSSSGPGFHWNQPLQFEKALVPPLPTPPFLPMSCASSYTLPHLGVARQLLTCAETGPLPNVYSATVWRSSENIWSSGSPRTLPASSIYGTGAWIRGGSSRWNCFPSFASKTPQTWAVAQIKALRRAKMGETTFVQGKWTLPFNCSILYWVSHWIFFFLFLRKNHVDLTIVYLPCKYMPRWKRHGSIVKDPDT